MKEISQYLKENFIFEAFTYAPSTEEECKQHFNKKGFIKGDKIPSEFIDRMFDIWHDNFESAPSKIPFRCDDKHAKLSRVYQAHAKEIETLCKDLKVSFENDLEKLKINGVRIEWGEGSLKGNRAEKGLSLEDEVVDQLILIVQRIEGAHSIKTLNEKEFKNAVSDDVLKEWWPFYKGGALDDVLNAYHKDLDIDLSKVIIKTGSGNTARNSNNEIFSDDFEITSNDMTQVLKDSGNIIADVTIKSNTGNPVYVSVKMKASQLSGVSYRKAISKNEIFKDAVINHESWDEIKDSKEMISFINLCDVLGLYPEDVFKKYKNIYSGKTNDVDLEINDKYDPKKLGVLFQKLLGGNYWYVKPGIQKFVDYKDAKLKFDVEKARLSGTGKTITVVGNINGIHAELIFRTDSEKYGPWPYRLFPKISIPDLIQLI